MRDKRGIEDGPKTDKYQMDDRRRIDRRDIEDNEINIFTFLSVRFYGKK